MRSERYVFITKKHLPRRTFLRGMGVTLALPLLDADGSRRARRWRRPPRRRRAVSAASTCRTAPRWTRWTPAQEGAAFEFTETLKPLEKLRDRVVRRQQPGPSGGQRRRFGCRRRSRALGRCAS